MKLNQFWIQNINHAGYTLPNSLKRYVITEKIKNALKEQNINLSAFAKMMDKSPSEITKWMRMDHNFTLDTLSEIERKLKISLIDITLPTTSTELVVASNDEDTVVVLPSVSVSFEGTLSKTNTLRLTRSRPIQKIELA